MILSASGFRKIFAVSGKEEDRCPEISQEDRLICAGAAKAFFDNKLEEGSCVLLGRDSRPTGEAICDVIGKTLQALGAQVAYLGVVAVDEILCFSCRPEYSAFAYVSASHNPIGHNGFKFGSKGGVYNKEEVAPIIEDMKKCLENIDVFSELLQKSNLFELNEDKNLKKNSLASYRSFILNTNPNVEGKIGVVVDFNGSARASSIDKSLLEEIGMKVFVVNDVAGKIVHGIIPEGKNLETVRELLEKKHSEDPSFVIGYMPDCDGDRGNIVYIDESGTSRVMESQTVFALCVYSMLKTCKEQGEKNLAVAVNGPTSMRINDVASIFGASVFRAEVGEANVVNLADSLRKKGFSVPILGEGSNGGNISFPSRARDPMNTVLCIARLLSEENLSSALDRLPKYITTGVSEKEAVLHLETDNYRLLKKYYEDDFESEFVKNRDNLGGEKVTYRELQTDGIVERAEFGNGDKGGLKMVFSNEDGDFAFIWMRPSGTEPLFRLMADVKGSDRKLHDFLISWQRKMILSAQEKVLR